MKRPCLRSILLLAGFFLWVSTTAATEVPSQPNHPPVRARHVMVASDQALSTRIGVDILRQGGNAVDAAIAVGYALAVTLPTAGNLGGGGFMVIHDAGSGRDTTIDFREMAPASATRDMFLDARGNADPELSRHHPRAVGVPGTVAGFDYALRHYGRLPLATLLAPAIRLANEGFPVGAELARQLDLQQKHLAPWPATRAIFFRDGRPLREGERLVQKDLARSLQLIARHGPAAFYRGEIARRIAAEMKTQGGRLGLEDLARYRVVERTPVSGNYRGYHIVSMPPPSSGGTHIIELLNILERYPLRAQGADSPQRQHLLAEAMKLAFADRAEYLGDPDFVSVPVRGLTSRAYADAQAARIDPDHATPASAIAPGKPLPYESSQTTHYAVVDAVGNAVSTTYTLNLNFGSGIVATGTGILLNNEMDDFSAKPGTPNAFKLVGGEANAIAPGKRPLSSMSPTIVFRAGKPWLITGAAGGSRIISTVLQNIVNAIDLDLGPAASVAMPRIHHQWQPDILRTEPGLSAVTQTGLQQRGHVIAPEDVVARTQIIQATDEGWEGSSDTRQPDSLTAGY